MANETPEETGATGAPGGSKPDLGADIARILGEVKLPERHDFKAAADPKPKPPEPASADIGIITPPKDPGAPQTPPAAPVAPTPPPPENASAIVTPLRTLKDDLQSIVSLRKISAVRAVSLEEDRKTARKEAHEKIESHTAPRAQHHFGRIVLWIVLILILLGCVGAGIYLFPLLTTIQGSAPQTQSSILFAENQVALPIGTEPPDAFKASLAQAIAGSSGSVGAITQVVPVIAGTTTQGVAETLPATLPEFLEALGAHPPDNLLRALGSTFFFGFHTIGQGDNVPLLIIPVTSYDQAFAGMLSWEGEMDSDLAPVFTSVSPTTLGGNGLQSPRTFQDVVIQNYDARVLEDDSGNVVLYYSFPTPKLLVIAESPYTFPEVLSRLEAAREL